MTREWRYCGLIYKFFVINNIELKCSFVRCRKYHKSWSNGAAELHISVDFVAQRLPSYTTRKFTLWQNGRRATQLGKFTLWHSGRRTKPLSSKWLSVLISVTREWRYCGLIYKFFLINNIELKCSFVRCRKYHKSWSNGASKVHISIDLLCGTTAAELHNS